MNRFGSGLSPGDRGDPVADSIRREQQRSAAPAPSDVAPACVECHDKATHKGREPDGDRCKPLCESCAIQKFEAGWVVGPPEMEVDD